MAVFFAIDNVSPDAFRFAGVPKILQVIEFYITQPIVMKTYKYISG